MPNRRSFTRFVEQELGKFPHFVVFAVLEWVLIILLFLDGFIAFLANEFAKFFELRVPCLFCTRIDHLFVHNYYYNNSICDAHKKHVSSLAYCHNHKKLSDIRKMCELCLLSFATKKESDCYTYKSLVGILHKDDDHHILTLPQAGGDFLCSCCGESLRVKSSNSKARNGTMFSHAPAPAPSPRAAYTSLRNDEKTYLELPPIRHTELKFLSDSESEFVEDDEGLHGRNFDTHPFKEDVKAVKMSLLHESEDVYESSRTPMFGKGNKFFGIPLTDSGNNSPRWAIRISRKSPLERTELAAETYEAADMLVPGDHDSILNFLKRQVRIDRKSLMELYMELDEERSAAAVAANNAMAMITRLQAQKAAVQMEALQYQRMMEEQEEYDQEALQASNDLLAKREEEIRVLEAELEAYREKYGYLEDDSLKMFEDGISDEDYQEFKSQSYLSSDEKSECSTPFSLTGRDNNKESFKNLDVTIIPSVSKIADENSKEESTNSDGVVLPSFQGKEPFSLTGRDNNKESYNNSDVTIIPSTSKIADENSKEESTNNDGVVLPSFQGKEPFSLIGREDNKESFNNSDVTIIPSVSNKADENSKEESTNNDGVVLPSFQGKEPYSLTGREDNKESFNNSDVTIIPSVSNKADENSKEESTNNDGVVLPSFQGKEPYSLTGREDNKESFNNSDVTIIPSVSKIADENSKEESANSDGVVLPFFQGKAEGEDQNESHTNFKGEKTYPLGRLRKARHISSFDGVPSLQSSRGSVNQVDEDTGKGRTSKLTRQLSHLDIMVREPEANDESSKQEGKRDLAETTNKLRKLQNLVHHKSDT